MSSKILCSSPSYYCFSSQGNCRNTRNSSHFHPLPSIKRSHKLDLARDFSKSSANYGIISTWAIILNEFLHNFTYPYIEIYGTIQIQIYFEAKHTQCIRQSLIFSKQSFFFMVLHHLYFILINLLSMFELIFFQSICFVLYFYVLLCRPKWVIGLLVTVILPAVGYKGGLFALLKS